jgi:hypothetical protein
MDSLSITIPGYTHNLCLHGHPEAGQVWTFHGHPAVSLILGDRIEGTAQSRPGLVISTVAELDELAAVIAVLRARLAACEQPPVLTEVA